MVCLGASLVSTRPRQKLKARDGLVWRNWHDGSVVFNPDSGQTHLLDIVSREGLSCLQETALDVAELRDQLAERLEVERDDELRLYVERLVSKFDELGLLVAESDDS